MKRIAAISLVLVIIFALVGCDVSTRSYRRYPYNTAYDTTLGNANNGVYRAGAGQRMYNAADGAIISRGSTTRTTTTTPDGTINRSGALNPDLNPRFKTFNEGALRGGMLPATDGTGTAAPKTTPELRINRAR